MEPAALYCDVSLPVPLDQTFTYVLPASLHHRVQRGAGVGRKTARESFAQHRR